MLRRFVSKRFQVLFHSPPGVLFTFPSRYLSAIGHLGVFRLTRWSWQIHTGFHGPRATWDTTHGRTRMSTTGLPPTPAGHSKPFVYTLLYHRDHGSNLKMVPQPRTCNTCRLSHTPGLASSAFARHYSRNHNCFLFLRVLRCFTSPRSLYPPYIFRRESPGRTRRLAGFPHSEILGSQPAYRLPKAYRRLLRPSSAPDAKASTVCS